MQSLQLSPKTNSNNEGPSADATSKEHEQVIDPFNVKGATDKDGRVMAIDYNKLVDQFGTKLIDKPMLERFERLTGQKPHIFLRRGLFFSHRDFGSILDKYEKGKPFYLYTGRG